MKHMAKIALVVSFLFLPSAGFAGTLLHEDFDDANFASRGWYDGSAGTISTAEHIAGSTGSFECRYQQGASGCSSGAPRRHKFAETNSVYIGYWVKHSSNWAGSGKSYHPHMIYFLTNLNGEYEGLAFDRLTAYVEENQGHPVLGVQDGQNIDRAKIGQNLIGQTENRAVAGCNGTQPGLGHDSVTCYPSGSVYWNGLMWKGSTAYFFDPAEKSKWHRVEAYFQLNTVSNGIGQPNGIVRYWYDGQLVINCTNFIMRTGSNPAMKFNQLVIAPYIGDGSPADQRFWIDELTVATERSGGTKPSPPKRLVAQ